MTVTDETAPARVGDYELLALLGEGGMGVVHLARRAGRPSAPEVALKVLRPHIVGDEEARDRLAREVTSLSRVTSPRVAEVLDADPWGAQPYVVTRLVRGLPLHRHVREHGPLDEPALLRFAAGLAEALAAVHSVGVLHRDIKPGNVLVEDGEPVLIDFGLARMAEDPHLTATGWLLGTPGYLAPEILYGDEATPASDVHAWAATVVFAATGRPPAGTGPAMAIMDRVRRGEFDLAGVPASIVGLLSRCLAEEPSHRPGVDQLLGELDAGAPPLPAAEPTLALDRTRLLGDPARERVEPDQPPSETAPIGAEPSPRRGRRVAGLLGLGLVGVGLVAWAPYVGAAVLAVLAGILRFGSVTFERHTLRRQMRGRPRWYDVPASTVSAPAYLLFSLVGTAVLWLSAVVLVVVTALVLLLAGAPLDVGLAVTALAYVLCLWWGPGSRRVRQAGRRLTGRLARPTRTGPVLLLIGALACVVLLAVMSDLGPLWIPMTHAPWADGWLARVQAWGR
ncbi:serine/threonine-protein kinase [Nocardioides terrisoli]|uniref:serine/threonine-protein kinase n=1 Tax=Nocardioides terrisoli TaxID=3388267 RepID=UPI00287B6DF1|nr:serine/threonine-protein kinase [Nocardioides marmorisolisilvae]